MSGGLSPAGEELNPGEVTEARQAASLIVLRGPGPRTQGDARPGALDVTVGGRTVALDRPGLALYAPRAGAPPIGPFQISPGGRLALQSLLRTTAEPGGGGKGGKGSSDKLLGAAGAAAVIGGGLILGGKKKRRPQRPDGQQGPTGKQ